VLGIRTPKELVSHPLRGAIFETWVASEIVKHRTNRGLTSAVAHYREHSGAEVDLVIENPSRLVLIEAKSSTTPASRMRKAASAVRERLAPNVGECEVAAVYAGEQVQHRSQGSLIPWNTLHEPETVNLFT